MNLSIQRELEKLNIFCDTAEVIQEKNGISVIRVHNRQHHLVVKHFANAADRREISNYQILRSLGIPTIEVIAYTDELIVLEDILFSPRYRLGNKDDLNDCKIAKQLAKWYRILHDNGRVYVQMHGADMYDDSDLITAENILLAAKKTGTQDAEVWEVLLAHLHEIRKRIQEIPRTLTYNDFYYTNFIVTNDKEEALMFDYNLLGKGYVFSDLRNTTYSLGSKSKKVFLDTYGEYYKKEEIVDAVASPLVALIMAAQRNMLPPWTKEPIRQIQDGTLLQLISKMLE